MKRLSVNEKAAYTVALSMTALFVCAAILSFCLMGMLGRAEKAYSSYRTEAEIKLSDLEKKKNRYNEELAELEAKLDVAEKTRAELEMKLGQAEKDLKELEGNIDDPEGLYKKLSASVNELKAQLETKNAEVTALKNDIKELSVAYGADVNKQYEIVKQIYELLEDGMGGSVSLYYLDTERGHTFGYGQDKQYPSACTVAVPFALSLLEAASAEQLEYEKKLAEYSAANGGAEEIPGYTFKYDMSKTFVFDPEKTVSGSGIIKDSEAGTEYTYYQLFDLYLRYEDAVAEKELVDAFGNGLRNTLLKDCGTVVMKNDVSKTTAFDLAAIMVRLKNFVYGDGEYVPLIKDAMKNSVHNVLITSGIPTKTVLHQHGWSDGAYHDMALVMDEHPYVLVIATDLEGGEEVNKYFGKLAALIDKLHGTFYK